MWIVKTTTKSGFPRLQTSHNFHPCDDAAKWEKHKTLLITYPLAILDHICGRPLLLYQYSLFNFHPVAFYFCLWESFFHCIILPVWHITSFTHRGLEVQLVKALFNFLFCFFHSFSTLFVTVLRPSFTSLTSIVNLEKHTSECLFKDYKVRTPSPLKTSIFFFPFFFTQIMNSSLLVFAYSPHSDHLQLKYTSTSSLQIL